MKSEPFGLPRGSLRGLMTLILLLSAIVMVFVPVEEKEYATGLYALAGVALRDYFGIRQVQNSEDGPPVQDTVEG